MNGLVIKSSIIEVLLSIELFSQLIVFFAYAKREFDLKACNLEIFFKTSVQKRIIRLEPFNNDQTIKGRNTDDSDNNILQS